VRLACSLAVAPELPAHDQERLADREVQSEKCVFPLPEAYVAAFVDARRIELFGDVCLHADLLNASQIGRGWPIGDAVEHMPGLLKIGPARRANGRRQTE